MSTQFHAGFNFPEDDPRADVDLPTATLASYEAALSFLISHLNRLWDAEQEAVREGRSQADPGAVDDSWIPLHHALTTAPRDGTTFRGVGGELEWWIDPVDVPAWNTTVRAWLDTRPSERGPEPF